MRFPFDVILTQQLSPVTSSFPALWYKKKYHKPLITWVLDLWPESLITNSNFKKGIIIELLEKKINQLYSASDVILISSRSFEGPIRQKAGDKPRIVYFPNWAEDIFTNNEPGDKEFPDLPEGFNIVFAGSLGESQDLGNVLKCAKEVKETTRVNWIFVGSGRYKSSLLRLINEYGLNNAYVYPMHPVDYMPSLFRKADVLLLTLKGNSLISSTVPAKLQTYMACGKPLLAMISGETQEIIRDANCGLVCDAGDYIALAENAKTMSCMDDNQKDLMSSNSLKFYNQNFSRKILIKRIEDIL